MESQYVIMLVKEGCAGFWSNYKNAWVNLPLATVYTQEEVNARTNRPMLGEFVRLPSYNGNINVTINGYSVPSAKDVADAIVKALRVQGISQ